MSRKVFCVQCERYTRQGRCECNPSLSGQYDGDPYGAWKRAAEQRNSMSGGAMSGLALCEHRMPKGECHVSHCPDAKLADSYLVAAPAPRGAPGDEDARQADQVAYELRQIANIAKVSDHVRRRLYELADRLAARTAVARQTGGTDRE